MATYLSMSFLRPLPLPRPNFVRNILKTLPCFQNTRASQCKKCYQSTTSSPIDTPAATSSPPPSSPATISPKTSTFKAQFLTPDAAVAKQSLRYHVHRTASQQLPIYHLAKRGGNLHQTRIRRIDGNLNDLRDDLMRELKIEDKNIVINQLTRHIIIKGWKKWDVKKFLEARRF